MKKNIAQTCILLSWIAGMSFVFIGLFKTGFIIWLTLFLISFFFRKKFKISDYASVTVFAIIGFNVFISKDYRFYPYTGSIVYASFFISTLIQLLLYILKNRSKITHKSIFKNLLWSASFFVCLILSIILIPNPLYIILPLLIIIITFIIELILKRRNKI